MGVVWLAKDEELDREIALKFLPESVCLDMTAIAALKRETRFSLELTHPNIVRIYDFVHDDRYAAIAMEFIDGPTLSTLKAERPGGCFEAHEIAGWLGQLCAALEYAHSVGKVVHQDLKPGNLMIDAKVRLKITDFGIARTVSESEARVTGEGMVAGTLAYMSPQQMNGKRPTHANDIYSLGATIYDLLTSKPPFHSGAVHQQIEKQFPEPMVKRRAEYGIKGQAIPKAWETTTAACLAKLPEGRPASAAEVAARLGLQAVTRENWMTKGPRPSRIGRSAADQTSGTCDGRRSAGGCRTDWHFDPPALERRQWKSRRRGVLSGQGSASPKDQAACPDANSAGQPGRPLHQQFGHGLRPRQRTGGYVLLNLGDARAGL
jgi:serine/threonine protein kinase